MMANTTVHTPRVCVIGAGVCGLCAIKSCLEENLDVTCYEASNDIGGLWNINRKTNEQNQATVMESTIVNTSKEMFAYSDFPPPKEWPNWMHHTLVCKYLKMYAVYFNLKKYIQLNVSVQKVKKANDYDTSGKWAVRLSNGNVEIYDSIMICTGHYADPFIPVVNGIKNFTGTQLHSQSYKTWKGYEGKNVLLVGIGNSSLDIACELSHFAKQVYVSTRRGAWIWSRLGIGSRFTDLKHLTRFLDHVQPRLPKWILNNYIEYLANQKIDHEVYCLKPKHRFFEQHPIVSDLLPVCLANGSVKIKSDIKCICSKSVVFDDDTEHDIDTIIFCTGYTYGFPFLDENIVQVQHDKVNLYKFVFPPNLTHATLAFIGLVVPLGAIGPVAEMQSRWAVQIFGNKIRLPSAEKMAIDIQRVTFQNERNFYKCIRHALKIQSVSYLDELANFIEAKPNLLHLFLTDRKLFFACYFGPCTSYSYRLIGPNRWPGARNAILTTMDRVNFPLQTRKTERRKNTTAKLLWIVICGFCLLLLLMFI